MIDWGQGAWERGEAYKYQTVRGKFFFLNTN